MFLAFLNVGFETLKFTISKHMFGDFERFEISKLGSLETFGIHNTYNNRTIHELIDYE